MTTDGVFVVTDSARSDGVTLRYDIRLPWYRSLPLSAIQELDIQIDGVSQPTDRVRLEINGSAYAVDRLADLWHEVWFVQDIATVAIRDPAVSTASQVLVTTRMSLRSPYIMVGPERPLVTHSRRTDLLNVRSESHA